MTSIHLATEQIADAMAALQDAADEVFGASQ